MNNNIKVYADTLINFLSENAYEYVGKDSLGVPTQLIEEVSVLTSLIGKAEGYVTTIQYYSHKTAIDNFSKAGQRKAYDACEWTEEDFVNAKRKAYKNMQLAAKKAIFLSTVCKKMTGKAFISGFVDLNDTTKVIALWYELDAFMQCDLAFLKELFDIAV